MCSFENEPLLIWVTTYLAGASDAVFINEERAKARKLMIGNEHKTRSTIHHTKHNINQICTKTGAYHRLRS